MTDDTDIPGPDLTREEQIELLKASVPKWNAWRKANPDTKPDLVGAILEGAVLQGADLHGAILHGADLTRTILPGASLRQAEVQGVDLLGTILQGADLRGAKLHGANLLGADLQGAILRGVGLQGAFISQAKLQGADLALATVDGETRIWNCEVDPRTDFTGVGLRSASIDPGLLPLLEHNIRRKRWEKWYAKRSRAIPSSRFWQLARGARCAGLLLRAQIGAARWFWSMTDYGTRVRPLLLKFLKYALVFALTYWGSDIVGLPVVANLSETGPDAVTVSSLVDGTTIESRVVSDGVPYHWTFLRAFYFSIVTMTTLGFGDMYANPEMPWLSYPLLMVQVILGYVMLGALVTYMGILFTSLGPAGSFAEPDKKQDSNKGDDDES